MSSFLDIHQHLLYGLDDGPADKPQMEAMLRSAYEDGVRTVIATPHIAPGRTPFSTEDIRRRVEMAQKRCNELKLELLILPGAEMLYTYEAERYLSDRKIPTLADSDKVLTEFGVTVRYRELEEAVRVVLRSGHIPVLAHIERYPCLMLSRARTSRLRKTYGVQYQVNCDSLLGACNPVAGATLQYLLETEQIDYVASDAHNTASRRCRMQETYNKLLGRVSEEYADQLTGNRKAISGFLNR